MAYRRSNGKGRVRKIEPAVQTMIFKIPSTPAGTTGSYTIDLSQCASLMNRRFYRQGINWAVAGIKVFTATSAAIQVRKLPNTWVMSNAWEKAFRAWQRMNNEAIEETESVKPRFLDFKIYADSLHHAGGFASNLTPYLNVGTGSTQYQLGEWKSSKVEVPEVLGSDDSRVISYEIMATGASYPGAGASTLDAVSLIEGYAASRGLPPVTEPNTPADASDVGPNLTDPENWISSMFTDGTDQDEQVLERMIADNNQAPYPFEGSTVGGATFTDTQYPNGANQPPADPTGQLETHDVALVSGTTVGATTRMKGGTFPCGLVRLDFLPDVTSTALVQVDLVPGHHRGYLCEPMTEM